MHNFNTASPLSPAACFAVLRPLELRERAPDRKTRAPATLAAAAAAHQRGAGGVTDAHWLTEPLLGAPHLSCARTLRSAGSPSLSKPPPDALGGRLVLAD